MERRPSVLAVDGVVVVGQLAELLADLGALGERILPDALTVLVDGLGLRSAVLRSNAGGRGGDLIAVAGDVVRAVPASRDEGPPAGPSLELDVQRNGRPVALLVVQGARPSQLPALRAAAAVLSLALAASRGPEGPTDAAQLVDDAEADRDRLADTLHDGPVQALVVARYATDAAVRAGDPTGSAALVRDAVQDALVDLRRTLWQLRPRGATDLAGALRELSARLVEAGRPALDLQTPTAGSDSRGAELTGARATTAYRLVQEVCVGDGPVQVCLDGAALEIVGAEPLADPERWQRRAAAVGAVLTIAPGRLRFAPTGTSHTRPKATP